MPWRDDLFWAGTSFELEFEHTLPTTEFQTMMKHKFEGWLKVPYTIEDHIASVRVTTKEYIPIIKGHSQHPNIMIFNGLGSKGCLTGPFYARALARQLLNI